MDVKVVKEKVNDIEIIILDTLKEFQNITGVNIESIDIEHIDISDKLNHRQTKLLNNIKINISI